MAIILQDASVGSAPVVRVSTANQVSNTTLIANTTVDVASTLDFTQTTAGITLTIPNPTIATIHKVVIVENLSASTQTLTFTAIGGDTFSVAAGQSIAISWNGTNWRLLNPAQVIPEFGSVYSTAALTITGFGVSAAQLVPGLSFTPQTSGDYQIDANLVGQTPGNTNVRVAFALYNSLTPTVQIANSERSILFQGSPNAITVISAGSLNDVFTLVGGQTYQIQAYNPNATAGSQIPVSSINGRNSLSWKKISGFVPVVGSQSISGVTTLPSQYIQTSSTFTDVTSLNVTLPNAGKYEFIVSYMVRNDTINTAQQMRVVNGALTVLDQASASQSIANNAVYTEVTRVFQYTGTAGELIKVQLQSNGVATAQLMSDLTGGQTKIVWKLLTQPVLGISGTSIIGDAKSGFQSADHNGWILLNGRLKTTLTSTQQFNATSLGIGANLPDATNRALIQGTLLAQIGSSTIAQNQLPNATLSVSGSTGNAGAHSHTINGNANGATGGSQGTFSTVGASSWSVISSVGDHAHSVSGSTSSINGGVTQQVYTPAAIGVNQFIYLGL
jgi:hypothetical protein